MSDLERTRPRRDSRPSSRASDNDEFRATVPTLAARVGVPPRQPPSGPAAMFKRPSHTSESAKKRKMLAQSRDNATQPGPLSPSKRRRRNLLDYAYSELETREDRIEWLLSKLELRNPRKNYRKFEFEVEELEEMMNEMSDADMDMDMDEAPRRGVGIYVEAMRTHEQVKAPKNAKSQPAVLTSSRASDSSTTTKEAPLPASAPPLAPSSSRKPAPTSSTTRSTAKVSKARFKELRNMAANMRPAAASNHRATEASGNQRPGSVPSKPTGSSQAHSQGTTLHARHPAPNSTRHPVPSSTRHPNPNSAGRPTPPERPRHSAPTNGTSRGVRHPPHSDNGERHKAPLVARVAAADDDVDNPGNIGNANVDGADDEADEADDDEADDDEADEADDNEAQRRNRRKRGAKKLDAQLRNFGPAIPIVSLAMDMIRAKMAFEHPFPELIPAEDQPGDNGTDDDDDDNLGLVTKSRFQDWAEKYYDVAHRIVRRGKEPVEREERHVTYMSYQLSQFRHHVKKAADGRVPSVYGLVRGDPQSAVQATDLTTADRFLSPNLVNDTHRFKHDVIRDIIQAAFFDGPQSLGSRYQHWLLDDLMPRETIAFVACIIQRAIKSYIDNDKASRSLASDKDHAEFERYMGMMEDMTKTNQATRLENLQMKMLDTCLLATEGPTASANTQIQWEENDSEPDISNY
ncbi:hypothetical protein FRC06_001977 [Ceratobasidium sp. 370]|nr:hypothetical protein FRC06_001977 [Ceratobasidium sp. 370]